MAEGDNIKLIVTDDGSHSLFNSGLNETYHSFHGAVQESRYVFIKMGLDFWRENNAHHQPIKVLEIGMGTGLNVLLAAEWASDNSVSIELTTIEAYPIPATMATELNHPTHIKHPDSKKWFDDIHTEPWNSDITLHKHFKLFKVQDLLENCSLPLGNFDIVFFDAFAPNKQPDLWHKNILRNVFDYQSNNGIYVTYCAKGQLKRDLNEIGYQVETLPGPPGKKEMVRGKKNQIN